VVFRKQGRQTIMIIEVLAAVSFVALFLSKKPRERKKRYVHPFDRKASWGDGRHRKLKLWKKR
jgi:hypothetical protein